MDNKPKEDWEEEFDKEFQESFYVRDEKTDKYYHQFNEVKEFISYLLKKRKYTEEKEALEEPASLEGLYAYERSKLFNQATKTANLMVDLAKQYIEERYPGLEFRFEAFVAKRYKTDSDIILIDNFELVLNAIFPKKSMKENMELLYEVGKYINKQGMQYMSPFGSMKVVVNNGEHNENKE